MIRILYVWVLAAAFIVAACGGKQQQQLLKHSGELMADMIGNNLSTTTAETEIELNFAVVKIKHKIIRKDEK